MVCWLQPVNLTSVTPLRGQFESTNECLYASVTALVGSWKILLHTLVDPPTAGTAASIVQKRCLSTEVVVFFHNKGYNWHWFSRADTILQFRSKVKYSRGWLSLWRYNDANMYKAKVLSFSKFALLWNAPWHAVSALSKLAWCWCRCTKHRAQTSAHCLDQNSSDSKWGTTS